MANKAPIFLAFLVNLSGFFIFRNLPKNFLLPCRLPQHIFQISCMLLLFDLELYPKFFRKTNSFIKGVIEFLIALVLFEMFLCDFWLPLEQAILNLITIATQQIKKRHPHAGTLLTVACTCFEILRDIRTPYVLSAILSLFFLLIIIHGTRIVDFGVIKRCGLAAFCRHVIRKSTRNFKKMVGLKFTEKRQPKRRTCPHTPMCPGGNVPVGSIFDRQDICRRPN